MNVANDTGNSRRKGKGREPMGKGNSWRIHGKFTGNTPATHWELNRNSSGIHWEVIENSLGTHRGTHRLRTRRWRTVERIAKRTGNTRRRHWKRQVNTQENAWGNALGTNGATDTEMPKGSLRQMRGESGREPDGESTGNYGGCTCTHQREWERMAEGARISR